MAGRKCIWTVAIHSFYSDRARWERSPSHINNVMLKMNETWRIPTQCTDSWWTDTVPHESSESVMRFVVSEQKELSHCTRPPNSHYSQVFNTHFPWLHSLKPDTKIQCVIKVQRFSYCCCSASNAATINEAFLAGGLGALTRVFSSKHTGPAAPTE